MLKVLLMQKWFGLSDPMAEEMLKVFFPQASDGNVLPPELKGLTDGAQVGPPGVRRR